MKIKIKFFSSLFALMLSAFFYSQVIIGDSQGTAANKNNVLLEFANTNNKGIILPYVRTLPTSPTQGTILVDAVVPAQSRVKYYNGSTWVDLSGQNANLTTTLNTQTNLQESPASKAIIGSSNSIANGVLVLESNDKAMVLPIVSDVNNIPSPSPGMMVYVSKPGAKRLAVYNGERWSFWAPQ